MRTQSALCCCVFVCFLCVPVHAMYGPSDIRLFGIFIAQNSDWQNVGWLKEPLARIMHTASQVIQTKKLSSEDTAKTCQHLQQAFQNISITYQCTKDVHAYAASITHAVEGISAMWEACYKSIEDGFTSAHHIMHDLLNYLLDATSPINSGQGLSESIITMLKKEKRWPTNPSLQQELAESINTVCAWLFPYGQHLHAMATCLQKRHPKFRNFTLQKIAKHQYVQKIMQGEYVKHFKGAILAPSLERIFLTRDPAWFTVDPSFTENLFGPYLHFIEVWNDNL